MKNETEQKKWAPDKERFGANWRKMWIDMMDTRMFIIRQTLGDAAAKRYRPHTAEQLYFYEWGKLAKHVAEERTDDNGNKYWARMCDVCDFQQAQQVVKWSNEHDERFWREMIAEYKEKWKATGKVLDDRRAKTEATDEWKAGEADRERLAKESEALRQKIWRQKLEESANLGSDAKEEKHQSGQQGEQATERAAEAKSENVKGQDTNQAAR